MSSGDRLVVWLLRQESTAPFLLELPLKAGRHCATQSSIQMQEGTASICQTQK